MDRRIWVLFSLCLIGHFSFAQEITWDLKSDLSIKGADLVSIDNRGMIFYTQLDGSIYQTSSKGASINHVSVASQAKISHLEAGRTMNIFAFYKDLQRIVLFDRFLAPVIQVSLIDLDIGMASMATLGNNYGLWLFDESDMSLKKYDLRRQALLQHQVLNLVLPNQEWDIMDIKAFQNMVFLRTPDLVFIFDEQGNLLKQLSIPGKNPLGVLGECIYNIEDGKIIEYKWNTGMKTAFNLPSGIKYGNIALQSDQIVFYDQQVFAIYENPFSTNR
ncbi:hypothetical protein [Anditalea andensis]|uniref:Uncharacterized protein n=1 Tax=Anditalea andensis TaxID=1048983 RepID=A0A074KU35_9BACT|nr:hypothetical protein [Anditalea andensis]KEO72429.1 hypothetical protein EL17_16940 [Anditalea andensis]